MPIELGCTGCGQTLRVGDEHAGKRARCPKCGTIVQIPDTGTAAAPLPSSSASSPLSPSAESPFGPSASSPLTSSAPSPESPAVPASGSSNPFADRPDETSNPYQSPTYSGYSPRSHLAPHRGGMILAFGIIGLLCCQVFGIVAWVMGANDIKEIRGGRMDPSGLGMTQAGMIIGIVATVLIAINALMFVGMMIVGMAR